MAEVMVASAAHVHAVCSMHLGGAQMVRLSNARSELIGTRLPATQASNRCSPTRRNAWHIEPDTMDMVSTDESQSIDGCRPPSWLRAPGTHLPGTLVGSKKSAMYDRNW